MRIRRTTAIAAFALLASCAATKVSQAPENQAPAGTVVTAEQLYAHPEAYYGKTVTVSGFFTPNWLVETGNGSCYGAPSVKRRVALDYTSSKEKFLPAVNYEVTFRARFWEEHSFSVGDGDVVLQYGPDEVLGVMDHIEILNVDRSHRCTEAKG